MKKKYPFAFCVTALITLLQIVLSKPDVRTADQRSIHSPEIIHHLIPVQTVVDNTRAHLNTVQKYIEILQKLRKHSMC